jgi:hypothetical protein
VTRIVNSGNATELAKLGILGCIMVDLDFASGHLYLNDGFTEVTYGGHTYTPLGQFGGIQAVEETLDTIARPIVLTLSGVDSSLVNTLETEVYQNREVTVYMALIDQAAGTLVANPEVCWEGRMDFMAITIDRNKAEISLNCEHRLRREPRIARYTDPDQQQAYSGDTFFNYIPTISGFKSQWGNEKGVYGGPTGKTTGQPYGPRRGHW